MEDEGEQEDSHDTLGEDTDDALYQVCGAQLHRMIELRKKLRDAGGSMETASGVKS